MKTLGEVARGTFLRFGGTASMEEAWTAVAAAVVAHLAAQVEPLTMTADLEAKCRAMTAQEPRVSGYDSISVVLFREIDALRAQVAALREAHARLVEAAGALCMTVEMSMDGGEACFACGRKTADAAHHPKCSLRATRAALAALRGAR